MLQSILEGISQSAASVTTAEFFWCTAASLVLGVLAALLFMFRNEEYSPSLSVTLALLPLVVQVVILLVNGQPRRGGCRDGRVLAGAVPLRSGFGAGDRRDLPRDGDWAVHRHGLYRYCGDSAGGLRRGELDAERDALRRKATPRADFTHHHSESLVTTACLTRRWRHTRKSKS